MDRETDRQTKNELLCERVEHTHKQTRQKEKMRKNVKKATITQRFTDGQTDRKRRELNRVK